MTEAKDLWDFPGVFAIPIAVSPAEIDAYGHVNNAVYLRWLTECAWAHSAAVDMPEARCVELRRGMAVRRIELELLAAAYEGDQLLVGNWITRVDRLRATRQFQVINPATATTLLRGHLDFACINLDTGRPARMPPEFRACYVVSPAAGSESG